MGAERDVEEDGAEEEDDDACWTADGRGRFIATGITMYGEIRSQVEARSGPLQSGKTRGAGSPEEWTGLCLPHITMKSPGRSPDVTNMLQHKRGSVFEGAAYICCRVSIFSLASLFYPFYDIVHSQTDAY